MFLKVNLTISGVVSHSLFEAEIKSSTVEEEIPLCWEERFLVDILNF